MTKTTDSRGHVPTGASWAFDEGVTDVFDDMLARSIPQHDEMRETVSALAKRFAEFDTPVLDIGCSRGAALDHARAAIGPKRCRYVGTEISPPMLVAARERFAGATDVSIIEHDLRKPLPSAAGSPSVVLSILTLQFTPIEYRQRIVADVFERMRPGAFIVVEKILGSSARIDETLVSAYYDRKRAAGYSDDEIERKRHALEGVLVPVTARWNEELLRSAGFVDVECFWRSLNFAGWLALRR